MKTSEMILLAVIVTVSVITGLAIAGRITQRGPATVLPFKQPDCGCKGA